MRHVLTDNIDVRKSRCRFAFHTIACCTLISTNVWPVHIVKYQTWTFYQNCWTVLFPPCDVHRLTTRHVTQDNHPRALYDRLVFTHCNSGRRCKKIIVIRTTWIFRKLNKFTIVSSDMSSYLSQLTSSNRQNSWWIQETKSSWNTTILTMRCAKCGK